MVHDHLGGRPPQVDLAHEQRLATVLVRGSRRGLLRSAHDLADGGLAQALVESCLRRDLGVDVTLPDDLDAFVALFSESAGRVLVSLTPDAEDDLLALCREVGVPVFRLGTVTSDAEPRLTVSGQFSLPLSDIRSAWAATIPAVLAS